MTRLRLPFLLVAAATLSLACSAGAAPSPTPASLDGHTYMSTQLEGQILVPGTQVRLSFADNQVNAQAGCNMMSGPYTIEGDHLRTTQMSMTEMGCDQPRQAQDEWLARFLTDTRFALVGDTLTMTDGTAQLTLMDEEVVTPDQPLEGRRWVLESIVSGDAVSSVPVGVTAAIQVDGGRINVEAGCNRGGGSVEVTSDTLRLGPIATTKMACEAGPMSVETAVLSVLTGEVAYTIDADQLTLSAATGGLVFRAATN